MSPAHLPCDVTSSTERPMSLVSRLSNSALALEKAPSSVVQTGVKSLGWEKSTPQLSPRYSWKLIVPSVVSAVKSGATSPRRIANECSFSLLCSRSCTSMVRAHPAIAVISSLTQDRRRRSNCRPSWSCFRRGATTLAGAGQLHHAGGMTSTLHVTWWGPETVVAIDRPERRNAVDPATATALLEAFTAFDADDSSSVAILTGEGGTFCAGADLKALAGG